MQIRYDICNSNSCVLNYSYPFCTLLCYLMRLADLASILAQGCTLWTDSFKLSGTPARSGGFRFYKNTPNTRCPVLGGTYHGQKNSTVFLLFSLIISNLFRPLDHTRLEENIYIYLHGVDHPCFFFDLCTFIYNYALSMLSHRNIYSCVSVPNTRLLIHSFEV